MMKTDAELLRAAAERVRKGWIQGKDLDGDGNVCAMGALMETVYPGGVKAAKQVMMGRKDSPTLRILRLANVVQEALRLKVPGWQFYKLLGCCAAVAEWNDLKGQTQENVAAGLEFAALYLEEKEKVGDSSVSVGGQPGEDRYPQEEFAATGRR